MQRAVQTRGWLTTTGGYMSPTRSPTPSPTVSPATSPAQAAPAENQSPAANPATGDVINWQALDMPCSPTWYTSDQSTVQSQATALDPSLNGGDYSAYAGTWQAAELRASGGGSGG